MHAPSPSPGARRVSPPGAPPGTALDARANRSYPRRVSLPDPERTRRHIGLGLYIIGMLLGFLQLIIWFVGLPVLAGQGAILAYMCMGAVLAFPAGVMYLTFPRLLDRYDPEPWYALLGCLFWGGIAACGFSVTINSLVGEGVANVYGAEAGEIVGAVICAPIVEEFWKGLAVFGMFYFLKREFDGIVDGIIYASFVALGFAAVENVLYYGRAAADGGLAGMGANFVLRGILFPWGHPVYTSMTGIGFGLAREGRHKAIRVLGPLVGYGLAVMLHAMWNGGATFAGMSEEGGAIFCFSILIWFAFVTAFIGMIIALVRRRGRILRAHLLDEVALGNITTGELDIVTSAFGLLNFRMKYGSEGAEFIRAIARLSLSKWHTTRAQSQNTHTVSMDFILPLRVKIAKGRQALAQRGYR
ncbi:MAG: PrsW family intramembrane metalloprotease [Sandaracinaceae bacterium]|nr:PrsW family intramembrane metalloprotease [Sandaracinaceae bacterium]